MSIRLRQLFVFTGILMLAAPIVAPQHAAAQGDWSVKRDPFDKKVVARYKAILARNPADTGALAKLVGMYKRYRSIKTLIDEYEKAYAKSKGFADAAVLGYLHMREGANDVALPYFEQAAKLQPKHADVHASLGDLYRRAGQNTEARAAYDVALANTRNKKLKREVLRSLADLSLGAGDITAARGYYEKSIALDPRNMQIRIELGDALMAHNKTAEAIEVYREAEARLRSDPARRVEVIARIGQAMEKAGQSDQAVAEYRRAMSLVKRGYYLRKELTTRIVDIYRQRQGLPDLITYYEKQWKRSARGHFEWDVLARLYEETGNQEKAIEAFRIATKKAPHELDTQRRLIALLENSGREDEALKQYEIVIKYAPGEPRFQLELAERYWTRGQLKPALALLAKMERRFPGDAGVHAAVADLYTRWGKEDLALKAYERLVGIEPGEVSHLVNLGEQYYQRNQKKKAIATWKRILKVKSAANYARLGEVFAEHDLRNDALTMFSKAIKLKPNVAAHYKGRARVYERLRNYDRAIADWMKLLELTESTKKVDKPLRAEARREVVMLYHRRSRRTLDLQVQRWKDAFTRSPPDLEAGRFLVEANLKLHNFKQAEIFLEKLHGFVPEDTDVMQELVKLYRRHRKFDKAVDLLLALAKLSPGREREMYTRIAEIKTDAREDDEAIEYVLKALEKSPKDPLAHMRLAERYEAMQNEAALEKAVTAYEKTIELDPRNYTAYFRLARLYQREDATHMKAAALYREVLKRATDNEVLENAGRKAINLEELTGTLGELEGVVAPLAFTFGHKEVYRRLLVELYGRYVPILVTRKHSGGAAGAQAARELERLGKHGLKPLLEALNDDKDPGQQKIAVATLGHLGNRGAAAPLVLLAKRPMTDPSAQARNIGTLRPIIDIDTRIEALIAASRLADERILPQLIELSQSTERGMREAAIFGLGRSASPKAIAPLVASLDDYNPSVQAQACLGLSFARTQTVVDALSAIVRDVTRVDSTRAACAWSLGVIGDARAVPALLETLAEGNDEAQRLAAFALGRIADKRAVPGLLAANFNRRERIRSTVVWALARIADPKAGKLEAPELDYRTRGGTFDVDGTVASLAEDAGEARVELSPALLVGHEKELVAGIRDALERHTDLQVRMLATLDNHPDRLDLGPLTRGIGQRSKADRDRVMAVLERVGVALSADFVGLTRHHDSKVRSLALSVLSKTPAAEAAAALHSGLEDRSSAVRRAAMRASAGYAGRNPAAAAQLSVAVTAHLSSASWLERTEAARALGAFGKHAPVDKLVAALEDDFAFVREAAARALGQVGDPAARSALSAHTEDPDPGVAKAARASLTKLKK